MNPTEPTSEPTTYTPRVYPPAVFQGIDEDGFAVYTGVILD